MFTLEEKIDIVLGYIASDDENERCEYKRMAVEALMDKETSVGTSSADVDDMIFNLLKKIGVHTDLKGYRYLATAIKLTIKDCDYAENITNKLYPEIASKYNSTPPRVERSIRHAIEVVFDSTDMEYLLKFFGNIIPVNKGKLTNSQFISFCANEISFALNKGCSE